VTRKDGVTAAEVTKVAKKEKLKKTPVEGRQIPRGTKMVHPFALLGRPGLGITSKGKPRRE